MHLRKYHRALSSAQVQAHYAAGACGGGPLPGAADSPLSASGGWLPLTQPSDTLADLSGRNAPALFGGTAAPAYGWDTTLSAECIEQENVCLCQPDTILVAANSYRYGFNGMERDSELGGDDYDFGARLYDARIPFFFSVDPKASKYPYFSPYIYAGQSPIMAYDDGFEKIVVIGGGDAVGKDKNKLYS
jgi:RHS repeat-associated protein